jgi:hypothetical protein
MGILDDAIREHLELKRRHGVAEEELRRQEEEALGPARREVAPPESHEGDGAGEPAAAEAEVPAEPAAAEVPAEPAAAEGEVPAEPFDAAEALGEPPPPAPLPPVAEERPEPDLPEAEAEEEPGPPEPEDIHRKETVFLEFPPPEPAAEEGAGVEPAGSAGVEPVESIEVEPEESGLEPEEEEEREAEPEAYADEPELEPPPLEPKADHPPADAFLEPQGQPGGDTPARGFEPLDDDELLQEEEDRPEDADVLEDTPDFLQETPEHDRLWFEQKPPRDFDFD